VDAEVPVRAEDYVITRKLQWLGLSLTPGVGAGRGRKLVDHFGGIDRLFSAPLTELEAAGLPAVSAQSIALGRSLELGGEQYDRVRESGAAVIVPVPVAHGRLSRYLRSQGTISSARSERSQANWTRVRR